MALLTYFPYRYNKIFIKNIIRKNRNTNNVLNCAQLFQDFVVCNNILFVYCMCVYCMCVYVFGISHRSLGVSEACSDEAFI